MSRLLSRPAPDSGDFAAMPLAPQASPVIGYWRQMAGSRRVYWSPSLFDVFGVDASLRRPNFDYVAARFEDGDAVEAMLTRLRAGEIIGPVDLWLRHPGRGRRLIRISGGLERDEEGLDAAYYGVAADITDLHQIAAQTAARERLLTNFIDHAPAALAMFDTQMRYLRANPRWSADFALGEADLIGRSHYEVFPEIPQRWKDIHARCLAGASERCERDLFIRADGRRQWVSWEIHPWHDETGAIGGILMLTRDITELITSIETIEQTERRLQLALTAGDMMVWQRERRTGRLLVSGANLRLMGRESQQSLTDEEFVNLIHPDDRAGVLSAFAAALAERRRMRHEMRIAPPGAAPFWARCDVEPLFDESGTHAGSIGLVKDISLERREKEELAAARQAAEAASKAKSDFLAAMSHEVRTPLNGVLGVAQVLAATELDARQRELVSLILSAGAALKDLVDDALDVERIESDALMLRDEPFDLHATVAEASYLFAPAAAQKGLSFSANLEDIVGLTLSGDAGRVRQVVSNLVGNAVKFTERGAIGVAAEHHPCPDGRLQYSITVTDTGRGVDSAEQNLIFERFRQGAQSDGGAGLGLTIARGLARAMGGDVVCASPSATGSAFVFTALAARAPAPTPAPALAVPQLRGAVKILVVEDHPQNRKIVELMLEPFGAQLEFADDGYDALRRFERAPFDLVLMDLQMPRMDGVAAIAALRAHEETSGRVRTPILCLTAQNAERLAAAREAGADGHLSKPIVLHEFIAALESALADAERASAA